MQAWREQDNFCRKDRQLSFLALLDLIARCSPSWVSHYANNISSSQVFVLLFEWDRRIAQVSLTHDLHLDSFISNIVEHKLVARGALVVDSSSHPEDDFLVCLARLEGTMFAHEVSKIEIGVELVGEGDRLLGLYELVDVARSNFEVLLYAISTDVQWLRLCEQLHLGSIPSRLLPHWSS